MMEACGSQTYLYVPFLSVTVHVKVPLAPTPVFLLSPGPVRWKLWMFERSFTTILYFPALSDVTLVLPFFRVIVKPGPSVPVRVGTAAEAEATNTSAAPSSATRARRVRNILLLVEWSRPQNFCREKGSGECSGQALSTADLIATPPLA